MEAVFVVCICIWTLMALCYGGMYVHDRLLLESVANEQTASWVSLDGENMEKLEKQVDKKLGKKMFLMRIQSVVAEHKAGSEKVTVKYTLPISWGGIKNLFAGNKTEEKFETERESIRPSEYKWDVSAVRR